MKKSIEGITLIALVITIIVLLILAGVSIATLTGPNGLLTQAEEARIATEEAAEKEKNDIEELEKKLEEYTDEKKPPESTTYTIEFDANGGEGTIEKITVQEGEEITLPENTFTRKYASFINWNTISDATGEYYTNKANVKVNKNMTLYAQWENYGETIQDKYENIYCIDNSKENIEKTSTLDINNLAGGNYDRLFSLFENKMNFESIVEIVSRRQNIK